MSYRTLAAAVLECLREPEPGEECVQINHARRKTGSPMSGCTARESAASTPLWTSRLGSKNNVDKTPGPAGAEVVVDKDGHALGTNEAGLNRGNDSGPEEQSAQEA